MGDYRSGVLESHSHGPYREWFTPIPNESYVIGIDVAEGLSYGDYSCAQVLDSEGNQVACYHGHIDPYEYGNFLAKLGERWNRAYLVVERNNQRPDYTAPTAGTGLP